MGNSKRLHVLSNDIQFYFLLDPRQVPFPDCNTILLFWVWNYSVSLEIKEKGHNWEQLNICSLHWAPMHWFLSTVPLWWHFQLIMGSVLDVHVNSNVKQYPPHRAPWKIIYLGRIAVFRLIFKGVSGGPGSAVAAALPTQLLTWARFPKFMIVLFYSNVFLICYYFQEFYFCL